PPPSVPGCPSSASAPSPLPCSTPSIPEERQGDRETRRQGDRETLSSPCLPVSLSPCLLVFRRAAMSRRDPQPAVSLWRRFFVEPWQRLEQEQRDFLASPAARRFDFKVAGVLVTVAVCLSLQYYFITARDAFDTCDTTLRRFG